MTTSAINNQHGHYVQANGVNICYEAYGSGEPWLPESRSVSQHPTFITLGLQGQTGFAVNLEPLPGLNFLPRLEFYRLSLPRWHFGRKQWRWRTRRRAATLRFSPAIGPLCP